MKITLNRNIYPTDAVFASAYSLLDKAHFLFDEDEDKNILVEIEPKPGEAGRIEKEFKDALVLNLHYKSRLEATKESRKMILQRALLLSKYQKKTQDENKNNAKKQ
jgi:His-Xaa-Ser system protein HxsD